MNVLPFNVRNVVYLNKKDTRTYAIYAKNPNSVLLTLEITENSYDIYYNGRRYEDFHSFQLDAYIIELIRKVAGKTHVLIEYLPESWLLGLQRVKILGVSNMTFSAFR